MSTPHNQAEKGMIAKVVLMPGDPLRAKYIAEHYLNDVICFNTVRNMYGYTGTYQGRKVSVMGSGMGMPSIGIYSYELFTMYDVETIIRIGSCGAYVKEANVNDVILVKHAYSESSYAYVQNGYDKNITYPDLNLNEIIMSKAKEKEIPLLCNGIHSSDVFYRDAESDYYTKISETYDCVGVEMESFALFHNAAHLNKKAACLLTVSDSFVTDEILSASERETSLDQMITLALEVAVNV